MATITFLYQAGLTLLGMMAISGVIVLCFYMRKNCSQERIFANLREEDRINKALKDIDSLAATKSNAYRIACDIERINQDALDYERSKMFADMIERYNLKFGIEKK